MIRRDYILQMIEECIQALTQIRALRQGRRWAEARQAVFAYAALSSACHYHPYELAPTASELTGWIADVETLVAKIPSLDGIG